MQHERVFLAAGEGFDTLRITQRTERTDHDGLGFTTRKQSRAMGILEHTHFDRNGTNGGGGAPINPGFATDDTATQWQRYATHPAWYCVAACQ